MAKADLTAQQVRDILRYDPKSGIFTWAVTKGHKRAGSKAGTVGKGGYLTICVDGRGYRAHRIALLFNLGRWPVGDVDHINGNTADNRIANLRECTHAENMQNMSAPRTHSGKPKSSKFAGVSWNKSCAIWRSQIRVNGKIVYLGRFMSEEAAHSAYVNAKAKFHHFQPVTRV